MKTIYIFERGILGWQSVTGAWQWPHEAVAWIHKNTPHKAQTITYFCGFIFPALTRWYRARQFAKLLQAYKADGWRIVLVAHSEGTATGLMAIREADFPVIDELHLICGACNSDCDANWINLMVSGDRLKHVTVYVAGKDAAMRLEDTYIGSAFFGLQCGGTPMGLKGPQHYTSYTADRMTVIHWPDYGHSDCWLPENFDATMKQIVGANMPDDGSTRFAQALSILNK